MTLSRKIIVLKLTLKTTNLFFAITYRNQKTDNQNYSVFRETFGVSFLTEEIRYKQDCRNRLPRMKRNNLSKLVSQLRLDVETKGIKKSMERSRPSPLSSRSHKLEPNSEIFTVRKE